MGVLLDPNHWTRAVNEIWRLRPTPGEPLSMDKARQILQIACKTLNDLVNDPDFGKDLKHLIALAASAPGVPSANAKEFADFIAQFQRAEREMLLSSKMEERAVVELLAGTAIEFANLLALASNVDEIERRVRWLAKKTCEINLDMVREEDRAAFVDDVRNAIAGIAMVAVDGVVLLKAAAVPPAAAAAKGSIKLGFNKLVSSLKRWF
jgi:hypothetical protein